MQYKCKDLLIKENSIFVQFKEFTVSILFIIKLFLSFFKTKFLEMKIIKINNNIWSGR